VAGGKGGARPRPKYFGLDPPLDCFSCSYSTKAAVAAEDSVGGLAPFLDPWQTSRDTHATHNRLQELQFPAREPSARFIRPLHSTRSVAAHCTHDGLAFANSATGGGFKLEGH